MHEQHPSNRQSLVLTLPCISWCGSCLQGWLAQRSLLCRERHSKCRIMELETCLWRGPTQLCRYVPSHSGGMTTASGRHVLGIVSKVIRGPHTLSSKSLLFCFIDHTSMYYLQPKKPCIKLTHAVLRQVSEKRGDRRKRKKQAAALTPRTPSAAEGQPLSAPAVRPGRWGSLRTGVAGVRAGMVLRRQVLRTAGMQSKKKCRHIHDHARQTSSRRSK